PGRLEMPIVGSRDTDHIDAGSEKSRDRIRPGETLEPGERASVAIGSRAGPRRDRRQFNFDQTELAAEDSVPPGGLEHRPVRLVKDHPEPDHAGPEAVGLRHEEP